MSMQQLFKEEKHKKLRIDIIDICYILIYATMLSVIIIKRRNSIRNLIINFIEAPFDGIILYTFMIQPLILVFRKQVCSHYLKRKKQWANKRN